MKLCKDCQFVQRSFPFIMDFAKCVSPSNPITQDPVNGKIEFNVKFCNTARQYFGASVSTCGPAGLWFEPRVSRWSRIVGFFKKS